MMFTEDQRAALLCLLYGRCYDGEDRTMRSLEQRGLVHWTSEGRYGKNNWRLTDVGQVLTNKWMRPE